MGRKHKAKSAKNQKNKNYTLEKKVEKREEEKKSKESSSDSESSFKSLEEPDIFDNSVRTPGNKGICSDTHDDLTRRLSIVKIEDVASENNNEEEMVEEIPVKCEVKESHVNENPLNDVVKINLDVNEKSRVKDVKSALNDFLDWSKDNDADTAPKIDQNCDIFSPELKQEKTTLVSVEKQNFRATVLPQEEIPNNEENDFRRNNVGKRQRDSYSNRTDSFTPQYHYTLYQKTNYQSQTKFSDNERHKNQVHRSGVNKNVDNVKTEFQTKNNSLSKSNDIFTFQGVKADNQVGSNESENKKKNDNDFRNNSRTRNITDKSKSSNKNIVGDVNKVQTFQSEEKMKTLASNSILSAEAKPFEPGKPYVGPTCHQSQINPLGDTKFCVAKGRGRGRGRGQGSAEFHPGDMKPGQHSFTKIPRIENDKQNCLNLIVLGQSGVGKSTWINSLVTYLKFGKLSTAENNEIIKVAPTTFTITNDNYDVKVISNNCTEIEKHDIGSANTKNCQMYSLRYQNKLVNLIDTPGIGDPGGLEQDKINIESILHYISYLDEIHGICILLKPNETRLNTLFKFCINEILMQLNKKSIKNIIFCLTNSRSTLYKPGETLVLLQSIVEDMKLDILIDKSIIYCLDNEAYRYLCTSGMKDVTYTENDKESFEISYEKSCCESKRLLDYVCTLKPHRVNDTTVLYRVRKDIQCMMQPVADAICDIEDNIEELNQKLTQIGHCKQPVEEIKIQRHKTVTRQTTPKLFCYSGKCTTIGRSKSGAEEKKNKVCEDPCKIKGAKYGMKGDERISNSRIMAGDGSCKVCSCSWKEHKIDNVVQVKEQNEEQVMKTDDKSDISTKLRENKKQLVNTKRKLVTSSAKLSLFLKKNSLFYNDLFRENLLDLIEAEKTRSCLLNTKSKKLPILINTLANYDKELESLKCEKNFTELVTIDNVLKWKNEIFQLPYNVGKNIKDNVDNTMKAHESAAEWFVKPTDTIMI